MEEGLLQTDEHKWDIVITPRGRVAHFNVSELWRYRDLMYMFLKRDIITVYKQTILGPIWFVLQPLLTTLMFLLVFTYIAKIPTNDVPPILFYMIGTILWSYFSDTLNISSKTFTDNASIFGKVYFPRLILPLSKVASGFIKFLIQFALFLIVWMYYLFMSSTIHPNWHLIFTPFLLFIIALLGLAFGIIITAMTTKYRDLVFLIAFGVQLGMYITPVIIPLSGVHKFRILFLLNPLTSLFEAFKYGFLGKGTFSIGWIVYSTLFTLLLLVIGIITFNKVEKRFIDVV